MSVKREDNICTITFEDENWKEEAPEVSYGFFANK